MAEDQLSVLLLHWRWWWNHKRSLSLLSLDQTREARERPSLYQRAPFLDQIRFRRGSAKIILSLLSSCELEKTWAFGSLVFASFRWNNSPRSRTMFGYDAHGCEMEEKTLILANCISIIKYFRFDSVLFFSTKSLGICTNKGEKYLIFWVFSHVPWSLPKSNLKNFPFCLKTNILLNHTEELP